MKNKIIYGSLGIVLYLISGTFFWGNHILILPFFLGLMMTVSFLINRNKSASKITENLISLNVPIIGLLMITSIITNAYEVGLPYLLLTPLVALANYYLMTSQRKTIPLLASVYLIAVGLFYFNVTMDISQFPSANGLIEYLNVIGK